jgi:hypothetical protein
VFLIIVRRHLGLDTRLEAIGFRRPGIRAKVRPAPQVRPRGSRLYLS